MREVRICWGFFTHPKTKKLEKRLGEVATVKLLNIWFFCAENRIDGRLTNLDHEDLQIITGWDGDIELFIQTLIDLRFLDKLEDGTLAVHNWLKRQPEAARYLKYGGDRDTRGWASLRLIVFQRDGYICQYCQTPVKFPDCDHVIPVCRGGDNRLENLVTACRTCNRSKGASLVEEWQR